MQEEQNTWHSALVGFRARVRRFALEQVTAAEVPRYRALIQNDLQESYFRIAYKFEDPFWPMPLRGFCISPDGPSTQHSRTLVPKTIPLIAFGTKVLAYLVHGPAG